MNPIYPIILRRTTRAAAAAAAFQIVYRLAMRKTPPLWLTAATNLTVTAYLCADLVSTFTGPMREGYPKLLTFIPCHEQVAALTFDDGPDPESTPVILKILAELDVHATFFLIGEKAELYPELVNQIRCAGHSIALHGYRHITLADKSEQECISEIARTKHVLGDDLEPLFRPPYGFKSYALQRACLQQGVTLTTWSINPKDYTNLEPEKIVNNVVNALHPGAVVLLHEWSGATQWALPKLVSEIRSRGYTLIRLTIQATRPFA